MWAGAMRAAWLRRVVRQTGCGSSLPLSPQFSYKKRHLLLPADPVNLPPSPPPPSSSSASPACCPLSVQTPSPAAEPELDVPDTCCCASGPERRTLRSRRIRGRHMVRTGDLSSPLSSGVFPSWLRRAETLRVLPVEFRSLRAAGL